MRMKHRNELPLGCNISLLVTLMVWAIMGKENRATDGAFRRFRQA